MSQTSNSFCNSDRFLKRGERFLGSLCVHTSSSFLSYPLAWDHPRFLGAISFTLDRDSLQIPNSGSFLILLQFLSLTVNCKLLTFSTEEFHLNPLPLKLLRLGYIINHLLSITHTLVRLRLSKICQPWKMRKAYRALLE